MSISLPCRARSDWRATAYSALSVSRMYCFKHRTRKQIQLELNMSGAKSLEYHKRRLAKQPFQGHSFILLKVDSGILRARLGQTSKKIYRRCGGDMHLNMAALLSQARGAFRCGQPQSAPPLGQSARHRSELSEPSKPEHLSKTTVALRVHEHEPPKSEALLYNPNPPTGTRFQRTAHIALHTQNTAPASPTSPESSEPRVWPVAMNPARQHTQALAVDVLWWTWWVVPGTSPFRRLLCCGERRGIRTMNMERGLFMLLRTALARREHMYRRPNSYTRLSLFVTSAQAKRILKPKFNVPRGKRSDQRRATAEMDPFQALRAAGLACSSLEAHVACTRLVEAWLNFVQGGGETLNPKPEHTGHTGNAACATATSAGRHSASKLHYSVCYRLLQLLGSFLRL